VRFEACGNRGYGSMARRRHYFFYLLTLTVAVMLLGSQPANGPALDASDEIQPEGSSGAPGADEVRGWLRCRRTAHWCTPSCEPEDIAFRGANGYVAITLSGEQDQRVSCLGVLDQPGPQRESSIPSRQPHRPISRDRRKQVISALLVVGVFAGLTAVMTYPQVSRLTTAVADHEDPLLSIWRLSWIAHQLPRDPTHLFDGNIFHPERRTLAFTDAVLLPGIAVAPLHWLGVPNILVYNLVLLTAFVFSAAAMYLLVRTLTGSSGAAWLAGIVFAFVPYRFAHYEHLELQLAYWMPLGLWAMHRTLETGRWKYGVLTGALVAAQALSSLYYGIFFGLYLALVTGVLLVTQPSGRRQAPLRALLAGAVLAAAVSLPYTIPYFANRSVVGERPASEVLRYSALPQDYLATPGQNLVYGWTASQFGGPERQLFPGLLVLLLTIIAASPPVRRSVVAYAVGLVFAFDASLGMNGYFYGWAYHNLPGFQGLRAPARFGILVALSLAVLGGYGAARLLAWVPSERRRRLVVTTLGLLLLLEYGTAVRLFTVPEPPAVYAWLRREPTSVVVELPLPRSDNLGMIHDGLYMYFSTTHWHRLVNGYSGFYPPSFMRLLEVMRRFPDDASIDALRDLGVDYAIVHGRYYTPEQYADIITALETRADVTGIGRFPAHGGESRVYRVLARGTDRTSSQ
jgi:hypothetical protein